MKTKLIVIVASLLVISTALAGSIVGVGVVLYRASGQAPVIVKQVLPNSPAAKAGLQPGFSILSIDGTRTADKSLAECTRLIRGAPDTQVTLEVVDPLLHQTNLVTLT